jgi:molecular chaperone DnaK
MAAGSARPHKPEQNFVPQVLADQNPAIPTPRTGPPAGCLARPLCIELSDGNMYEVFKAGDIAKPNVCSKEVAFFCTDNRDGQARLIVKEGAGPFRDHFVTKQVLTIPVSTQLPKPYKHERVIASFVIDEDLTLRISAKAATQSERTETVVYDLCFALKSFGDVS